MRMMNMKYQLYVFFLPKLKQNLFRFLIKSWMKRFSDELFPKCNVHIDFSCKTTSSSRKAIIQASFIIIFVA